MSEINYDEILSAFEKTQQDAEPSWVIARSVEEAEAFAAWCVENGIEEPEIAVIPSSRVEKILADRR